MTVTTPLARPRPASGADGPVLRVVARRFDEQRAHEAEPDRLRYELDFLAEHGLPMRPDLSSVGLGNTFAHMGDVLVDASGLRGETVDAVLLAHRGPDIDITELTASHLADAFTGDPDAFSLSNDGVGAPFRALDYALGLALDEQRPVRVVLVVAEQTAMLYEEPAGVDVPTADTAVLVAAEVRPGTLQVDVLDGADATAHRLRELADAPDVTLAVGRAAARLLGRAPRACDVGVCTSAWTDLAGAGEPRSTTVVADYDPVTGHGHVATFRGRS